MTRGEFKDGGSSFDAAKSDSGSKDGASEASATDSGSDGTAAATAFTGAGAWATGKPATSAVTFHTNNSVSVVPGKDQDCLTCHKMAGSAPQFLFAGTIFQDMNGTTPAVDKEVRVRGSDGKAYSAHSDADGNFWYLPGTGESIAFPAQSGARDATNTTLMVGAITASSCNAGGCHDGTTQKYLHLP